MRVEKNKFVPDEQGVVWRASSESIGVKCFLVSLHRTGTRSMSKLLSNYCSVLQYPVYHEGVDLESRIAGREHDLEFIADVLSPALDSYDSVTDAPLPVLYRQLHFRYPTAKFILLLRNPFDWVRSVRRHLGKRAFLPYERVQYWHYLKDRPRTMSDVHDQQLLRMNALHTADIIQFFQQNAPGSLGVFELRPESGPAILAFLGMDGDTALPLVP
jgi:hypothetical protein